MSRRKNLAPRKPCGRLQPGPRDLMAPVQVRRLVDAAADGLCDPVWSTTLGRLYLTGKLAATEFAAGKRWTELAASYSVACRSPARPRTVSFDARGGTPTDPDSETGEKEAARHARTAADWIAGRDALRRAGSQVERVVTDVCELDQAPAGVNELEALRNGLRALSNLWSARRKAAR